MILRPRQVIAVERATTALATHGNTLLIAPTGAGKTVMLAAVAQRSMARPDSRVLVLQHRDELTDQNARTFARLNPHAGIGIVDAARKEWDAPATFAMVQTLASSTLRRRRLPRFDAVLIDEAHHAAATTYRDVLKRTRDSNPNVLVFGCTATPNRGDRRGLREVFSNVCDQIGIGELVASGHLVRPRTLVIDLANDELIAQVQQARREGREFDQDDAARLLDTRATNDAIVAKWQEHAAGRRTVAFATNIAHAVSLAEAFRDAGIDARVIDGTMRRAERRELLAAYAAGAFPVIVNVAVLTEGFDDPPTSCCILARPSSAKGPMIQMVGRVLRPLDPERHPGMVKLDALVLDFGASSLLHGTLEQDVDLTGRAQVAGPAPTRVCPECEAVVPAGCMECPVCGAELDTDGAAAGGAITDFDMREIDLLERSNFAWLDILHDATVMMAGGLRAWAAVVHDRGDLWQAIGGSKVDQVTRRLASGERAVCMAAADDFLNATETSTTAHKSRAWLRDPPTERQLQHLPQACRLDRTMTRCRASALISYRFNLRAIRQAVPHAPRLESFFPDVRAAE